MRKKKETERRELRKQYLENKFLMEVAESVPGGLRGSAFHEASHAVVAELFHFPIDHIRIKPERAEHTLIDGTTVSGVRVGGCQHVLNEEGVVELSSSVRQMCYHISEMASLPTEKKLGILTSNSVMGDLDKVFAEMGGALETRKKFAVMMFVMASVIVNRTDVWAAISEIAQLLLTNMRVSGEEIRSIMSKHIPPSLYTSEEEQTELSKAVEEQGGVALHGWGSKFQEAAEEAAA